MAGRLVPYYTYAIDCTQVEEDDLALTITGQEPFSRLIFNTTIGRNRIWDGVAFQNAPLCNPDGGTWSVSPLIPQEFTFIGGLTAWTNKNVALQEFLNTNQRRLTIDLTNATQFRIKVNITTQGVAASVTGIQYSIDGGTTWRGLDNGNSGSNSTVTLSDLGTGSKITAWTNLATGAKVDCLLRIAGSGGDGASDPAFNNISIQLK